MINKLHSLLHRPERAWDPVPRDHAISYGTKEWQHVDEGSLDELARWVGGFSGKRVLDLGGGPGHYSAAFARRGAEVTWHDVSLCYREMAQAFITDLGLADRVRFSLGYMDEAASLLPGNFDLVFNRICWNYGFTDSGFAKVIYRLVAPGGWAYVDTHHSGMRRVELAPAVRLRTWLNDRFAILIRHPYPPHGRVARLFMRHPVRRLLVDYRLPSNDRILMQKPGGEV